jgi:predicted PurR-regulated permease PerM
MRGALRGAMTEDRQREQVDVRGLSSTASFTNRVLIIAAVVALAFVAWRLASVFLLLFAAIVLAMVLRVLSDPISRHTGIGLRLSLAIVVLALFTVFGLAGWLFGDRLSQQIGEISTRLPKAWESVRAFMEQSKLGRYVLNSLGTSLGTAGGGTVGLAGLAKTTFGAITDGIIIFALGLYLAARSRSYLDGVVKLVPPRGRPRTAAALEESGRALRRWLFGQGIAMLTVGVLTGIGLWILGIPMALSLAMLAGLLEFVPFFGPIASAVPAVLIAFAKSPADALYVLILYVVVHQLEGDALIPIIQEWSVKLPPLLAILSVVVFGYLFGIPGVVVATPLMVVGMVLVRTLYIEGTLGDTA